jgi:hypothetical protein
LAAGHRLDRTGRLREGSWSSPNDEESRYNRFHATGSRSGAITSNDVASNLFRQCHQGIGRASDEIKQKDEKGDERGSFRPALDSGWKP